MSPANDRSEPSASSAEDAKPWWSSSYDEAEPSNPHDVGSLTQEAVKLAAAVIGWAEQTGIADTVRGAAEQATEVLWTAAASRQTERVNAERANDTESASGSEPGDAHSVNCEYCPICQGMDLLKNVPPETRQGLAEAMSAVSDKLRAAVDGLATSTGEKTQVERIDID